MEKRTEKFIHKYDTDFRYIIPLFAKKIGVCENLKKQLCSNCKRGMESYEKDKHSPMCPYIWFHNGEDCKMYVEYKNVKNNNVYIVENTQFPTM